MAKTVAFINGKGGVGKSTICFLTGLGLGRAGKPVWIKDLDPQKSVTAWIDQERDGIGDQSGVCLIDTPPRIDSDIVIDAISRADRIILPCSPSPADIIGMRGTIDTVVAHKAKKAKVAILLNNTKKGTRHTREARGLLEGLKVTVLENSVPERECIQDIVTDGWRAMDAATQANVLEMTIEIIA